MDEKNVLPDGMLSLDTEEEAGGEVSEIVNAGSEVSVGLVLLLEVSVRVRDQVPDAGERHPRHEEAAHEGQQRVPEGHGQFFKDRPAPASS